MKSELVYRCSWPTRADGRRAIFEYLESFYNPSNQYPTNDSDQLTLPKEIEVTDPIHPLFGRRFEVLSIHDSPASAGYVFVSYRGYNALCVSNCKPPIFFLHHLRDDHQPRLL